MISDQEIIECGVIRKPYGNSGEMLLQVKSDLLDEVTPHFLVVRLDNINVPFLVESVRTRGNDYVIRFADTADEQLQRRMTGQKVFFLRRELPEFYEQQLPLDQLVGFDVYDSRKGYLGKIAEVNDSTANVLIGLDNDMLLPLHDDLIEELDIESCKLILNLPEGLTE